MNLHDSHHCSKPNAERVQRKPILSFVLTDDFRQRRRITVVLMTAWVYIICAGILVYGSMSGLFSEGAMPLAIACLCTTLSFFLIMRIGWNLRFAQPSLALPQALCAQTLITLAYAVSGPVHPSTLMLLASVLVFGMFEMNTANVWKLMAYSICSIGLVMAWSSYNDPFSYQPKLQLIYFVLTTTVLISISSLSLQLRGMRERLKVQKTELEEALKQIRQVATHDELTGLPNRRYLLALLAEHAARRDRGGPDFMVALADLDHFKNVNDTFGHRVGDEALACFAKQARMHLRSTDVVGRWGGEEFLIILPESPPGDPNVGIERLRGALAVTEISRSAPHIRIAFSTGITRFVSGAGVDDVIERADRALYLAKAGGRNQTVAG